MRRTLIRAVVAVAVPVLILASTGFLWTVRHPSTEPVLLQASTAPVGSRAPLGGPVRVTRGHPAEQFRPDGLLISGTVATIRELSRDRPVRRRISAPLVIPSQPASPPARSNRTPSKLPAPSTPVAGAAGEQFALVNQDRQTNGVLPLAYSATLARVAQYRAQDMLNRNYFSHYDPETGKVAFVELFHAWGITYAKAGENIAWSTNPSMAGINTLFMNSPEHRDNILNPAFHQVGIGVASDGHKTMVAEVFTN